MNVFAELQRRNVIRMAGLYLVGAWLLVQVAGTLLPVFEAPAWIMRSLVTLLSIGFVLAIVIAWVFEWTPQGLRRDAEVPRAQSHSIETGRRMDRILLAVSALAIGYFLFDKFVLDPRRDVALVARTTEQVSAAATAEVERAKRIARSIAVLPFVNMSEDAEQAYFADGISEEILNALVRVPDLKVAGRTSSFAYKGRNEDLRKISSELGVNHILEGSVRRAGERLRITAQLIRSEDGFHLWSETFDRDMTDVFAVQEEIARSVAEKLQLSLGLGAKALVTDTTQDIDAYAKYLQARALYVQRGYDNLRKAELLLTEVVARDPAYASGWSALASVYNVLGAYAPAADLKAFFGHWRDTGLAAARRAIALDASSARAQHALGSMLASRFEWIPAFEALARAAALAPDDADILDTLAQTLGMVGYREEALALSLRIVALEPRVAIYRNTLGLGYWYGGDPVAAEQQFKLAMEIDPALFYPDGNLIAVFLCGGRADEALALAHALNKANVLPANAAARFAQIEAPTTVDAIARALQAGDLLGRVGWCIGYEDAAMDDLIAEWASPNRMEPYLFVGPFLELWRDPRWKAQARKDGVLDLWRVRGFPSQCRPVGSDDFECLLPEK